MPIIVIAYIVAYIDRVNVSFAKLQMLGDLKSVSYTHLDVYKRQDKEREAGDGHDGTWVAHPGLVPIALDVFDRIMPQPNQLSLIHI